MSQQIGGALVASGHSMRLKRHAGGALRRLPLFIIVAGALWLGLWVRVHGALHYPFNADEIVVIQNGVRDMYGIGPDRHLGTNWATLVFGVPLRNSHSLAPLWWWLQAGTRFISPANETLIFRVLPVALGVLGVALFYRVAAPVLGGLVAALLTGLLSTNDVFVYVSSKSQFFDLLPFVLVMLMARPLLMPAAAARDYWIAALATTAAFATSLVRAMVLTAGVALAGAMAVYWAAPRLPAMRAVARQTGRILLALLPVALWWAGTEWFFQHNPVRVYDLGYYGHFRDALLALLGYGPRPYPQPFLTGPGYWAFLVYTHADLYPAFTFAALPILFGCALATVRLLRGPGARAPFYIYLLLSIGLPLAAQAAKGLDAARLHMVYLFSAYLAAGLWLEWLLQPASQRMRALGTLTLLATGSFTYSMLGWQDWPSTWTLPGRSGTLLLLATVVAAGLYWRAAAAMRPWAVSPLLGAALLLSLVRGPLQWGMFAYEEPGSVNPHRREIEQQLHPLHALRPFATPASAMYAGSVALRGYTLLQTPASLQLDTTWQAADAELGALAFVNRALDTRWGLKLSAPYHLFVHLVAADGQLAAGNDALALNPAGAAMDKWLPGEVAQQRFELDVRGLPPGRYRLGTGVYNYATGARLPVAARGTAPDSAGWLLLQEVQLP